MKNEILNKVLQQIMDNGPESISDPGFLDKLKGKSKVGLIDIKVVSPDKAKIESDSEDKPTEDKPTEEYCEKCQNDISGGCTCEDDSADPESEKIDKADVMGRLKSKLKLKEY